MSFRCFLLALITRVLSDSEHRYHSARRLFPPSGKQAPLSLPHFNPFRCPPSCLPLLGDSLSDGSCETNVFQLVKTHEYRGVKAVDRSVTHTRHYKPRDLKTRLLSWHTHFTLVVQIRRMWIKAPWFSYFLYEHLKHFTQKTTGDVLLSWLYSLQDTGTAQSKTVTNTSWKRF